MQPHNNQGEKSRHVRQALLLVAIPMLMLAAPIIGYVIGRVLDSMLDTTPWLRILFLFIGLGAGMHQSVTIITRVARNSE
jgi:F0F1-type ATP synthase assembly protein I